MSTLQELSSSTSTTLSPSDPESTPNSVTVIPEEPEDLTLLTPIQSRYTFWYRATDFEQKNGSKVHVTNVNYKDTIKKIASFGSVSFFLSCIYIYFFFHIFYYICFFFNIIIFFSNFIIIFIII